MSLHTLRRNLARLLRRRLAVRWGMALCALVSGVLCVLLLTFFLDWMLRMSTLQRVVLLALAAGCVWAIYRHYAAKLLAQRESLVEMALFVERDQHIDSDLVAALEFETAASASSRQRPTAVSAASLSSSSEFARGSHYGSPQLQTAVVNYVSEFSPSLNVFHGLSYRDFIRRVLFCVAMLAVSAGLAVSFPAYANAFWNRLLLGSARYPSRTQLSHLTINGQTIPLDGRALDTLRAPYARPLRIRAETAGTTPDAGEVRLVGQTTGSVITVDLKRPNTNEASTANRFDGEMPRLTESVTCEVFLGDAYADPIRVAVIPLPVVSLEFRVTPPEYVSRENRSPTTIPAGQRQFAVLEGSRVQLVAHCANKTLAGAWVTLGANSVGANSLGAATGGVPAAVPSGENPDDGSPASTNAASGNARLALKAVDPERKTWRLTDTPSPFDRVDQLLTFEVQVEDTEGLSLEHPLTGQIRIEADRAPRVAAGCNTLLVRPIASPRVTYGATDDFGLGEIRLHRQVIKADGTTSESVETLWKVGPDQPRTKVQQGRQPVDLQPLKLVKGDQVRVTIEAIDDRGSVAGRGTLSEAVVFQVTDDSGVLAGLSEADEKSARQLESIIQRQLGIGESP